MLVGAAGQVGMLVDEKDSHAVMRLRRAAIAAFDDGSRGPGFTAIACKRAPSNPGANRSRRR